MIWRTVFRLEWRILRRDRGARNAVVVFGCFVLLSAFLGGLRADALTAGLDALQATDERRLKTLLAEHQALVSSGAPAQAKDPRDPLWVGQEGASRAAVLEAAPLAAVALGSRELRPQAVRISTSLSQQGPPETESPMVGPTRQRSGAFDPAFVFIVLFPLLIISLSYELLSGERERGTLAMLLSQPIRQTDLAVGKAGARFAWVAVVTFVLAFLGLVAGGVSLSQPGAVLHAFVYVLVLLGWGGVWFAAALWVNSRHGTSASNALALVGAWLIVVIIVPGLIKLAVDTVYPAPSSMELVHTAREAGLDAEKTLTNLKGRHDRDTSTQDYKAQMIASEEMLAARIEPVLDAHRQRQERRSTILNLLAYLSPAMIVEQSLEDIAGTSGFRQGQFQSFVSEQRRAHRATYAALIQAGEPVDATAFEVDSRRYRLRMEDTTPTNALLERVLPRLLFMLMLSVVLVLLAWPGLKRIGRLSR